MNITSQDNTTGRKWPLTGRLASTILSGTQGKRQVRFVTLRGRAPDSSVWPSVRGALSTLRIMLFSRKPHFGSPGPPNPPHREWQRLSDSYHLRKMTPLWAPCFT